ncbi:MAG TPA: Rieske (2Fe-2S) protein, partial [Candidatus Dormibacteraeota bacterium]|nr:Rieske (2Fe-2S) protein [Candidatus Dormibacteraeota bacterium]
MSDEQDRPDQPARRVDDYVEALLHDRQPRRFPAEPEEAELLRVAAELRGLRPGADLPRREFIDALRARLARQAGEAGGGGVSRRALLAGGAAAAAALAAGVGLDRALEGSNDRPQVARGGALEPRAARWVAVAELAALP